MRRLLLSLTMLAIAWMARAVTATVYVQAEESPYLYCWYTVDNVSSQPLGIWPGTQMTETEEIKGIVFWKMSISTPDNIPFNIIFNNGWGGQTEDILGLSSNRYFIYDGYTGYTDITEEYGIIPNAVIGQVEIRGDFNEWEEGGSSIMTKGDGYVYTLLLDLPDNERDQWFKLVVNGSLYGGIEQVIKIDAPEGWLEVEGGYIVLRNSITGYKSYILTAIWEENPDAIQGWTLKVEGKELRTHLATLEVDPNGYYLISSPDDWMAFATIAEETPNANAKMTTDIDLGNNQIMIGSNVNYKGVFNGQGHTLVVDITAPYCAAPFSRVEGATIENLHVKGRIEATTCGAGGIVGDVYGKETATTIRRCWSSSLLVSGTTGGQINTIGGIASNNKGVLIIEDCLFDGQFADKNRVFNGGFVSNTWYDLTIRNGLNIGSYLSQSSSGTFHRTDSQSGTVNLENVYYKNVCGTPQGTQVTDEQLADGTVTALLQNGRSEGIWIQGDGNPILAFNAIEPIHYTATITTDKKQYQQGEAVIINGAVNNVTNADVDVCVTSNGVSQTITVQTDAQGAFITEWIPISGLMGHFSIGVTYEGINIASHPAVIDIIGLKRTSNSYITCETAVGDPFTGEIEVMNPCGIAQQVKSVEVLTKPANCEVETELPTTIAAVGKALLKYTLTGSAPTEGQNWEQAKLRLTTEEGATLEVTLYYYCRSQKAVLAVGESQINTTMVKGTSRDYPVTIGNQGKGDTGNIQISMPNLPWLKLVTPAEMSSLAYGEQATVMLRLTPGDNLPLNIPQTGTIGVNCENGDGIAIPFSVEVVSETTGTLTIDVVDEFSGNDAAGPHVDGAIVEVKHPTSGAVVAQGTTGADGKCSIELPEGYYSISVTADKHSSYTNYVLVDPGRETTREVFLSYQAITYSWTMEETEVEDMYEIVTTVTYETNVPKPVLVITLPNKKPGPNEIFPIELTNEGLINVEHVDMTAYCSSGFEFEILNNETLEVLGPHEKHTYNAVIKGDAELWPSSCINAYVVADGYYECRGMQHIQARADLYRCTQTQQGDNGGGSTGTWPGALPPVINTGNATVTGGTSGGTAPWINWPCESCLARVKLEFVQTMTMNRPAYRGTLTLYNGHESVDMTNVSLHFAINGTIATEREFAITVESLSVFTGEETLPGDWTLGAGQTGTAKVLFVPTLLAAPDEPKAYTFSGTLTCIDPFSGQQLSLPLSPSTFTVYPLPNLELTYLMQRDVYADDPLTDNIVEPSELAEFALIINNVGNGEAKNVRIITEQPKVTDNDKGLLIDFSIEKSQVNGQPANLFLDHKRTNDFGNISAHSQTYAQWWLRSSLLGHFVSYDVECVHLANYGNSDLSLVNNVTIHEMTHGFTPLTDGLEQGMPLQRGWLVNDIADADDMPDVVYFSDASQQPLNIAAGNVMEESNSQYKLVINPNQSGWNYGSLSDPTKGRMKLTKVIRQSDGTVIPLDNVWQTDRTFVDGRVWLYENRIHFVGNYTGGSESYLLTFDNPTDVGVKGVFSDEGSADKYVLVRMVGDRLHINGNFSKMKNVAIYDLQGIKRVDISNMLTGQDIYIGRLKAGVYYIQVSTDQGVYRVKAMKR